jgi:hypothetical protein
MLQRTMGAIVGVGLAVHALPAMADPRTDVLNTAARCNAIADYRVWLDCYYGAAQPMREILGLTPAPPSQVKLVPQAGAPTVATAAPADGEDFAPRQPMADYSFDAHNRFTVRLEDGSVWRQIQEDSVTARWRAAPASYTASVGAALVGLMMRVSDGHSYRVRRVR